MEQTIVTTDRDKRDEPQPFWFWLDFEMTGLDPRNDRILEAGVLVTDRSWQVVDTWQSAVFQPPEVLAGMNAWCQQQHSASGLVKRVPEGISEELLDEALTTLTARWRDVPVILCGNSIGQDRKFADRWLPRFASRLHYRMLDVSSFKIVFENYSKRRYQKKNTHRALDDIRESIGELRFYLEAIKLV